MPGQPVDQKARQAKTVMTERMARMVQPVQRARLGSLELLARRVQMVRQGQMGRRAVKVCRAFMT